MPERALSIKCRLIGAQLSNECTDLIYLLIKIYLWIQYNFLIFCALRGGGVVQRMEENHQDASQEDAAEAKEAAAKEKADRAEKKQQAKEEAKKETLYKLMR